MIQENTLINKLFTILIMDSLEQKLKVDEEYQKISKKRIDISQACMDLHLPTDKKEFLGEMLDKIGEYETLHGDYAYRAGVYTCIDILKVQGKLP